MPPKGPGGGTSNTAPAGSSKSGRGNHGGGGLERTKVVVRKAPAELPPAVFWKSLEGILKEGEVDWKTFKQGRSKKIGQNKDEVESVAYLHFKRADQVTRFAQAYQGHTFRDSKGHQSSVVVEYAPFQKIPLKKQKPDPLSGTVDEDADYLKFVASLTEAPEEPKSNVPDVQASYLLAKSQSKSTPLLEELRRKKAEAAEKRKAGKSDKDDVDSKAGKASRSARKAAKAAKAKEAAQSKGKEVVQGEKPVADKKKSKEKRKEKKGREGQRASELQPVDETPNGQQAGPSSSKPKIKMQQQRVGRSDSKPAAAPKVTILAPPRAVPKASADQVASKPAQKEDPHSNAAAPNVANKISAPAAKSSPAFDFSKAVDMFAKDMASKSSASKAPKTAAKVAKTDAGNPPKQDSRGDTGGSVRAERPAHGGARAKNESNSSSTVTTVQGNAKRGGEASNRGRSGNSARGSRGQQPPQGTKQANAASSALSDSSIPP